MLTTVLIYLLVGACAGSLAGLFGIGGGLIIVPVLILAFEAQQMSPQVLTHAAIATALAVNVLTSLSAIRTHHSKRAVLWRVFTPLALGIGFGAIAGVNLATRLDGDMLRWLLGGFLLVIAIHMFIDREPQVGKRMLKPVWLSVWGTGIGGVSAMFGIGGAIMTIPLLRRFNVAMQQAVATAAACGFPIAVMGTLTNVWRGWEYPGLAEWSLGYVYLPAFCGIIATSAIFASLGARLSHRLQAQKLQKLFAVFLLLMGLRFLLY